MIIKQWRNANNEVFSSKEYYTYTSVVDGKTCNNVIINANERDRELLLGFKLIDVEVPDPVVPPIVLPTYDELANMYIRQRYSESQEFAILRQRDTKSVEYNAYYNYCESCKARARAEIAAR